MVYVQSTEKVEWPGPITLSLDGAPGSPSAYVYKHTHPVPPGQSIEVLKSEFIRDGVGYDSRNKPLELWIAVPGYEMCRSHTTRFR